MMRVEDLRQANELLAELAEIKRLAAMVTISLKDKDVRDALFRSWSEIGEHIFSALEDRAELTRDELRELGVEPDETPAEPTYPSCRGSCKQKGQTRTSP